MRRALRLPAGLGMRARVTLLAGAMVGALAACAASPPEDLAADGGCGRIDWAEITQGTAAAPEAARLHGAYAWEVSEGGEEPVVAGARVGFLWLACPRADAACSRALAAEISKEGRSEPIFFGGSLDRERGPEGLFAQGEAGSPTLLARLSLGLRPAHPDVCPAAFALPPVPRPSDG
jgi:hypothetical protein